MALSVSPGERLRLPETAVNWPAVFVAGLAMVATLPGRTHGLGLVTEPLLADLQMDRVTFGWINLGATLLGAAFCLPVGWLLDRLGGRFVFLAVTLGLAGSVIALALVRQEAGLALVPLVFALVLLTRGLGQSALSVVSLALMGRSTARSGFGVGVYSVLVSLGFMAAFGLVKVALEQWHLGWRELWAGLGVAVALLGLGVFASGIQGEGANRPATPEGLGLSLGRSLRTPAFWVFAGATSLYGLVAAGLSLFNQSILAERGFAREVFLTVTTATPLIGLAANLLTGWLVSRRMPQGPLLAAAMLLLALALLGFPLVRELWQVYAYAVVLGVAGGMVTVIFFGVWGQTFGTRHLGQIQGAAQMLTVLASAAGPLLLAQGQRQFGSYVPVFQVLAGLASLLALAAWLVPLPVREGE